MPATGAKIRQAKATDKALKLAECCRPVPGVRPNSSKLRRYHCRIAGKESLYAIGDYPIGHAG